MESKMDTVSLVREFVVENFLFGDGEILKEDTSFMEESIIDSTGILELVFFIEETFDIKIEDTELVPENFDSLSRISKYIESKNGS
jgi:acyl carrier protein